jgi:hypothetical protein
VIYDQVDGLGFIGVYQVVTPIVVPAGTSLCLEAFNGLTTATVYGHLEKDKCFLATSRRRAYRRDGTLDIQSGFAYCSPT